MTPTAIMRGCSAAVAQLVERNLAKVEVESSRLFCRSRFPGESNCFPPFNLKSKSFAARWQSGYAAACKAVYLGSIPGRASSVTNVQVSSRSLRRSRSERAAAGCGRSAATGMYVVVHEDSEHRPSPDPARAVDLCASLRARMVKLVDTRDLKSLAARHADSTSAPGTIN